MAFYFFQWTDDVEQKLADHGLSPDDFEAVVSDPVSVDRSRSSGRRGAFGNAPDGRYIVCFYELLDDGITVIPVTAYEVSEP